MNASCKIGDYAIIGDGRSAALISRSGSLDWLCWPQFDSPALFGRLLDQQVGGHWSISPLDPARTQRRYSGDTNVLQTRFETVGGSATLTDFMPAAAEDQKARLLWPEQEIIREIACNHGEMEFAIDFQPRPDFGRASFRIHDAGSLGLRMEIGLSLLTLRSDANFQVNGREAVARLKLRSGQTASFSLSRSTEAPAVLPLLGSEIANKRRLTLDWWRQWAGQAKYQGTYRESVIRSALVLKLLSFAPSGAIIAAPTTSLPERIGGDLNWDYRYCWLRDGAFTARALFGLGFDEEAEAFVSWMLHATRLTRPELRVLYGVYGGKPLEERELPHLSGFAASSPVRIGNAARDQVQLDVYGQVIEAVTHFADRHQHLDGETQQMLRHFGSYVCRHWHEPDHGIWEPRGERKHYTHSRLMCWVALDRLLNLHQRGVIRGLPATKLTEHRQNIRQDILNHAWNAESQCYTQTLGGHSLDATAFLLALHGFEPAESSRMQSTCKQLRTVLGAGHGLLYRNEQSFEKCEATFALCGFWLVEFLARGGGPLDEAHRTMEGMLTYANDVGLFGEEIDARTGEPVGNFPQAFTHIGLINAALAIAEREKQQQTGDRRLGRSQMPSAADPPPRLPIPCSPPGHPILAPHAEPLP